MQNALPGVGWDDDEYTVPPDGIWGLRRTFSALYVAATVAAGMAWIRATSVPGIRYETAYWTIEAFLVIGGIWILSAAITAWRIAKGRARRPGWYLFVVPVICFGLVISTVLALPLRAKFEFARSDFDNYAEAVLEGVDPATVATSADSNFELVNPEVPGSMGGFSLSDASIVPEGLIIFDTYGAGFAYLPDGKFPPDTGPSDTRRYRSLGEDWYSFTSNSPRTD